MTKHQQSRTRVTTHNDRQLTMRELEDKWRTPAYKKLKQERRARRQAKSCFID